MKALLFAERLFSNHRVLIGRVEGNQLSRRIKQMLKRARRQWLYRLDESSEVIVVDEASWAEAHSSLLWKAERCDECYDGTRNIYESCYIVWLHDDVNGRVVRHDIMSQTSRCLDDLEGNTEEEAFTKFVKDHAQACVAMAQKNLCVENFGELIEIAEAMEKMFA